MTDPLEYAPAVAARFARLPHGGDLPPARGKVIQGTAGSPEEGVRAEFMARIAPNPGAQDRLAAVAFRAYGCPHVLAACSLAAEWLEGRPPADLGRVDPVWLAAALEIPPGKAGRLLIVQDALRNCLADWDNSRLPGTPIEDQTWRSP